MGDLIGYVEGADTYLVIAILIFMFVFAVATVYMFSLSKKQVRDLSNMPLSESKNEIHEN